MGPMHYLSMASEAEAQAAAGRARAITTPDNNAFGAYLFCGENNIDVAGYDNAASAPPYAYTPTPRCPCRLAKLPRGGGTFSSARPTLDPICHSCGVRTPYGGPRNS